MSPPRPPTYHPPSEMMWSYAVGNLDPAAGVLLATHLALCPRCRRELASLESAAGSMFEAIDATPVDRRSLVDVLAQIDDGVAMPPQPRRPPPPAVNPIYPRPLRDYLEAGPEPGPWRPVADGIESIDVAFPGDRRRMRILRVQPGRRLPRHGHGGDEITMVLAGRYRTSDGAFGRGDVESADSSTIHQPVADAGEPCICVTVTRGPLVPTAALSWLVQKVSRLWS